MVKIKITKEQVKGFVRGCCLAAYGVAAIAGACMVRSTPVNKTNYGGAYTNYGDAVQQIMSSSMLGSNKTDAIALLRRDEDAAYYNAVISIVNSSMLGSQKVEAIEKISNK